MIPISQTFYSGRSALIIELSRNGIFFTLAPALQKNEAGNMTYNWEQKTVTKFSISETILIKKALITYFDDGIEAYKKLGFFISKNEKYTNMQFQHVTTKGEVRVGLEVFNNQISFGIFKSKTESLKYPVQSMDYFRIVEFLDYITKQSFNYESVLAEEERIEKIGKVNKLIVSEKQKVKQQKVENNLFDKSTLAEILDFDISHLSEVNEKNDNEKAKLAINAVSKAESLKDLKLIMAKFNGLMKRNKEYRDSFNLKSNEILSLILSDIEKKVVSIFEKPLLEEIRAKYSDINNEGFKSSLNTIISNQELKIDKAQEDLESHETPQKDKIKIVLLRVSKMKPDEAMMELTSLQVNKSHILEKFPSLKREVANKLEMLKSTLTK